MFSFDMVAKCEESREDFLAVGALVRLSVVLGCWCVRRGLLPAGWWSILLGAKTTCVLGASEFVVLVPMRRTISCSGSCQDYLLGSIYVLPSNAARVGVSSWPVSY